MILIKPMTSKKVKWGKGVGSEKGKGNVKDYDDKLVADGNNIGSYKDEITLR